MTISASAIAYKLSFQLSPIILTNGIAQLIPGGMLPIISITESLNFTLGLLSGAEDLDLDNFFANFQPAPGASLVSNDYGEYPFANQSVAANAVISQPLMVSLIMTCPARGTNGFASKLATMTALQTAIKQHTMSGGTFTVATPSFIYTDCVLLNLVEIGGGNIDQPQSRWQWNFRRPLLSEEDAQLSMNSMMQKIAGGVPTDGALSGLGLSIGSPLSLASPLISPAARNLTGSNVANFLPSF